ncbi:DNA cytosine methyltransferase [Facklamia hominis]
MKNNMNFIDLFAGCGGLTEGFYKEGFTALTHVEIDKYACETLRERMRYYRYDEAEINNSVLELDITTEDALDKIINSVNGRRVDLIIGGPPCQSFSTLGRARDPNGMKYDYRNYLFEEYVKILNHFKPKIFVFENVMGLLTAKLEDVNTIDIILKELGKEYKLINNPNDMVLNASNYGVPQERKRVIIIGVRKDIEVEAEDIYMGIIKTHYSFEDEQNNENLDLKKYVTVRDAISDLPKLLPGKGKEKLEYVAVNQKNEFLNEVVNKKSKFIFNHTARNHNEEDQERYMVMAKENWTFLELLENRPDLNHDNPRVFGNSYVVQEWNRPSKTIISHLYKDGNQFIHPDYTQKRTLTAREAARLQSFSDDFVFTVSRTQQYKQIGNAVPPLMARQIAKSIKHFFEKQTNKEEEN